MSESGRNMLQTFAIKDTKETDFATTAAEIGALSNDFDSEDKSTWSEDFSSLLEQEQQKSNTTDQPSQTDSKDLSEIQNEKGIDVENETNQSDQKQSLNTAEELASQQALKGVQSLDTETKQGKLTQVHHELEYFDRYHLQSIPVASKQFDLLSVGNNNVINPSDSSLLSQLANMLERLQKIASEQQPEQPVSPEQLNPQLQSVNAMLDNMLSKLTQLMSDADNKLSKGEITHAAHSELQQTTTKAHLPELASLLEKLGQIKYQVSSAKVEFKSAEINTLVKDLNKLMANLSTIVASKESGSSTVKSQQVLQYIDFNDLTGLNHQDGITSHAIKAFQGGTQLHINTTHLDTHLKPVSVIQSEDSQNKLIPVETGLERFLKQSDDQQQKTLEWLAKQIQNAVHSDNPDYATSSAGTLSKHQQNADTATYLSQLKLTLGEMREQLKQGHISDLDLSAAVNRVIQNTTEGASLDAQARGQLDHALKQLSQSLEGGKGGFSITEPVWVNSSIPTASRSDTMSIEGVKQNLTQTAQSDRPVNIFKPEGQQQLVEKVRWLVNQNQLQADIRLDPPELGSMKIRVSIQGDAANVNFVVQTPHAKDMLDQAVPRLRTMLQESGIDLGQSSVHQDGKGEQQAGRRDEDQSGSFHASPDEGVVVAEQPIVRNSMSGIDYFV
jgi:flagellar hook-length control protein FliK